MKPQSSTRRMLFSIALFAIAFTCLGYAHGQAGHSLSNGGPATILGFTGCALVAGAFGAATHGLKGCFFGTMLGFICSFGLILVMLALS